MFLTIFFLIVIIILFIFIYDKYFDKSFKRRLLQNLNQQINKVDELKSETQQSNQIIQRKNHKQQTYSLQININTHTTNQLPKDCQLITYQKHPLISFSHEYQEPTATDTLIYQVHKQPNHKKEIIISPQLLNITKDTSSPLLAIPTNDNTQITIHIIATENTTEIYINNEPTAFFPLQAKPMIPENFQTNDYDNSFTITVNQNVSPPIQQQITTDSEFLPQTEELKFATTQAAVQRGNQILKKLSQPKAYSNTPQ